VPIITPVSNKLCSEIRRSSSDAATLVSSYLFEHGLRQYFVPVITQLQPFDSCASTNPPLIDLLRRFVTQALPWLSIPIPLPLQPVSKLLHLARVCGGKTCDMSGKRIAHPNPVLLVDN